MKKNKVLWLFWGLAILAIFILIGLLGWQGFYGWVIPRTRGAVSLPLTGLIGFSFLAGLLAFFAPCSLAVFPAYVAFFLAGQENPSSKKGARLDSTSAKRVFRFAFFVSAGALSFYLFWGVILAFLGTQLAFYILYLKLAIIGLIFVLGLALLTEKQLPTGFLHPLTNNLTKRFKNQGSFGYGVIYAIASATCFLPLLLTLALVPFLAGQLISGLVAFLAFGLALSLMLVMATLLVASGKQKLLSALAGKGKTIKKLSGTILIATALFLVAFYLKTGM